MNKEKKCRYHFIQISSEPEENVVHGLLNILENGGEIISAVGQAGSVQYILKSKLKEQGDQEKN